MIYNHVFGFICGAASLKNDSSAEYELPLVAGLKEVSPQFQNLHREPNALACRVNHATICDDSIKCPSMFLMLLTIVEA